MHKIILLNGPIACGKNVAVDRIKDIMSPLLVLDRRCKDHLFDLTPQFFCMANEDFFNIYNSRQIKETPMKEFEVSVRAYNALAPIIGKTTFSERLVGDQKIKLSVREALIYVSEIICKPTFGEDYFGVARARSIGTSGHLISGELSIDDSCGFAEEIQPTIDKVGMENVMLIRIHGRGSFHGDSRNYVPNGYVDNTVDIINDSDEETFLQEISEAAVKFYNER